MLKKQNNTATTSQDIGDATSEVYNSVQAREYLKVSKSTLYNMVRDRKISYYKPIRLLYFRKIDLDEYLMRNGVLSSYDVRARLNDNFHK